MIFELTSGNGFVEIYRDEDLKRRKVYHKMRPYFYVLEEEKDRLLHVSEKVVIEDGYESIFGDKCLKVFVSHPSVVGKLRGFFTKTFEADIPYLRRCVIDNIDKIRNEHYVVMFFDIEAEVKGDLLNPDNKILSISCWDNLTKEMKSFWWHESLDAPYKSEVQMLEAFRKHFRSVNPDVLTAWNLSYDQTMLNHRLGCWKLSEFGEGDEKKIKGCLCADLAEIYRHISRKTNSWQLKVVSEIELGESKIEIDELPAVLHAQGRLKELVEYNQQDVWLLVKLDEKLKMLRYMFDLQQVAGVPFGDIWGNSLIVDALCLRHSDRVLPSKTHSEEVDIRGGLVLEPVIGLHHDVVVFDAKAEYPSIIITCNISPETILKTDADGEDIVVLGNGVKFSVERVGLFPKLLRILLDLRQHYKDLGEDSKQLAVKYIANSVYGVCVFPAFRMFDPDCARSITYMGRQIVMKMREFFEKNNFVPIYGDTDSIFVKGVDPNEISEIQKKLNDWLKSELVKITSKKIEVFIEFDKFFSKLALSGKKRYCGYLKNGEFVIRGLEMAKTNAAEISRRVQRECVDLMFNEGDIDRWLVELRNGFKKLSLEEIAVPQKVHTDRDNPFNRAKKLAIQKGLTWDPLESIRIVYVKHPETDVIPVRKDFDSSKYEVDWEKMWKTVIVAKLDPLLAMINKKCIPLRKTLMDFG